MGDFTMKQQHNSKNPGFPAKRYAAFAVGDAGYQFIFYWISAYVMILKARAENGSESSAERCSTSSVLGTVPVIGGMSSGDGI